jgi:hypothetical protein
VGERLSHPCICLVGQHGEGRSQVLHPAVPSAVRACKLRPGIDPSCAYLENPLAPSRRTLGASGFGAVACTRSCLSPRRRHLGYGPWYDEGARVDEPSLFAWAYLSNMPAIQQYFSLVTNQWAVLLVTYYQPSERDGHEAVRELVILTRSFPNVCLAATIVMAPWPTPTTTMAMALTCSPVWCCSSSRVLTDIDRLKATNGALLSMSHTMATPTHRTLDRLRAACEDTGWKGRSSRHAHAQTRICTACSVT